MASNIKFASIESFSKEDLKELFDHICVHALGSTPLKVKQDVLKIKGTPKELKEHNPTIHSLLSLIATYDIKFEFKIKYVEKVNQEFDDLPEEPITDVKKEMADQKKQTVKEEEAPMMMDGKPVETVYVQTGKLEDKEVEKDLPTFED